MAEELNMHFSSVFTREDTSSLPVPETKFNGTEGERLGQLVITPEVIANKINNMKDNKSPGVDGIAPKILKETVEQISKPLAPRRSNGGPRSGSGPSNSPIRTVPTWSIRPILNICCKKYRYDWL